MWRLLRTATYEGHGMPMARLSCESIICVLLLWARLVLCVRSNNKRGGVTFLVLRHMGHIEVSFDAWIAHAHVIASSELSHV